MRHENRAPGTRIATTSAGPVTTAAAARGSVRTSAAGRADTGRYLRSSAHPGAATRHIACLPRHPGGCTQPMPVTTRIMRRSTEKKGFPVNTVCLQGWSTTPSPSQQMRLVAHAPFHDRQCRYSIAPF
ncbi:hypothetical protein Smlt0382 [Stenotrophomonas maltophilia K279a]|uniref:Uncharacterized protein n=1 Tax=Stenotrophomonas maltophilia (strain K279a) TaxID=522373 RepID=B2FJ53_STRMK|nr:hypothetical protein Smlt0382 [Stenotrophomonas maltophilia K279a]